MSPLSLPRTLSSYLTMDLSQLITDKREEVAMLERAHASVQPEYLTDLLDQFKAASEDFITWLSESDAMLKSGLSERTLRRRYREMLDCGTARWGKTGREYMAKCIPNDPDVIAARARGLGAVDE